MGSLLFASGRRIGHTPGVFVIAEGGVNHNGRLELGLRLIDAARDAGADAIKFQTFRASALVAPSAPKAEYQKRTSGAQETQFQMLQSLELSHEAHIQLRDYALEQGLVFMSSPFDMQSADMLVELGVPAIKLGSGELTNEPLLRHVAGLGLPVLFSSGMAHLWEVDRAVHVLSEAGCKDLGLMHCVSLYPTPPDLSNVRATRTLKDLYPSISVGFSDHTEGVAVSVAAVALGATMIEKHLTLDRAMPGPDHAASLDPEGFGLMVRMIREVEQSLGDGRKRPAPGEDTMAGIARRSLHVAQDVPQGHVISPEDLAIWRPAHGLAPTHFDEVVGMRAARALTQGEALTWQMLKA